MRSIVPPVAFLILLVACAEPGFGEHAPPPSWDGRLLLTLDDGSNAFRHDGLGRNLVHALVEPGERDLAIRFLPYRSSDSGAMEGTELRVLDGALEPLSVEVVRSDSAHASAILSGSCAPQPARTDRAILRAFDCSVTGTLDGVPATGVWELDFVQTFLE